MSLAANINSPSELWAFITNCFTTSGYQAHGFYHWGYRPTINTATTGKIEQALETTRMTVWGHFSALMSFYELDEQDTNWGSDPQWLYNWDVLQENNYFNVENINTRRYGNPNINFNNFFEWIKEVCDDATREVYDCYPSTRPPGWRVKLGPAKFFPGFLLIDAKGNAPNQFKPKGPLLQYTYNAGTKNAVTNAIMVAKTHEVVKDYAQYKAPPGWRGQPYDINQMYSQPSPKTPYQDWIDDLESANRQRNWMMYSDAKSLIFSKFNQIYSATKVTPTIPTINYEYRYYDLLKLKL